MDVTPVECSEWLGQTDAARTAHRSLQTDNFLLLYTFYTGIIYLFKFTQHSVITIKEENRYVQRL